MRHLSPWLVTLLLLVGCNKSSGSGEDGSDSGVADTESSTSADADSDVDTDSDSDSDMDTDGDSDSDSDTDADGDADTDSYTDFCDPAPIEVEPAKAQVLIVLDRSSGMTSYSPELWGLVGTALSEVIAAKYKLIDFGLMLFPDTSCDQKQIDTVCAYPSAPYVEIGQADANDQVASVFAAENDGGTGSCGESPIAPTLFAALDYMSSLPGEAERGVLLVINGAPNCNSSLDGDTCTCLSVDSCSSLPRNCLDDERAYAAAKALEDAGFPVFVMDMRDANDWADQLNGGYYSLNNTAELEPVLETFTDALIPCRFNIDWNLSSDFPDYPSDEPSVSIYCKETVSDPKDSHSEVVLDEGCALGQGWSWTDDTYSAFEFCEEACDRWKHRYCTVITAELDCPPLAGS
ncbi:MAG: hypothetical protein GY854_01100 [Deltaproteobacteria bacterium]|nr:hypothetical protein [Deltaproteobacteria bacterium]